MGRFSRSRIFKFDLWVTLTSEKVVTLKTKLTYGHREVVGWTALGLPDTKKKFSTLTFDLGQGGATVKSEYLFVCSSRIVASFEAEPFGGYPTPLRVGFHKVNFRIRLPGDLDLQKGRDLEKRNSCMSIAG